MRWGQCNTSWTWGGGCNTTPTRCRIQYCQDIELNCWTNMKELIEVESVQMLSILLDRRWWFVHRIVRGYKTPSPFHSSTHILIPSAQYASIGGPVQWLLTRCRVAAAENALFYLKWSLGETIRCTDRAPWMLSLIFTNYVIDVREGIHFSTGSARNVVHVQFLWVIWGYRYVFELPIMRQRSVIITTIVCDCLQLSILAYNCILWTGIGQDIFAKVQRSKMGAFKVNRPRHITRTIWLVKSNAHASNSITTSYVCNAMEEWYPCCVVAVGLLLSANLHPWNLPYQEATLVQSTQESIGRQEARIAVCHQLLSETNTQHD